MWVFLFGAEAYVVYLCVCLRLVGLPVGVVGRVLGVCAHCVCVSAMCVYVCRLDPGECQC